MAKRSGAKAKKVHAKARAAAKPTATPTAKTTAPKHSPTPTIKNDTGTMARLHKWNSWLAGLYVVQAAAILLLGVTKLFPVQVSYLTQDPLASQVAGHTVLGGATRHLFDLNMVYVVVAFLLVATVAHLSAATICREQYEKALRRGLNRIRWTQYAIGAGLMLVAIAVLSGASDLATLVLIFALGVVMGLSGLLIELHNPGRSRSNWLAILLGAIGGIVPWLIIGMYAWSANAYGGHVPGFVYGIYATMLVLFVAAGINFWLQHRRRSKWADYVYAERMYMVLGFAAKTLLAWQIFAGVLHP